MSRNLCRSTCCDNIVRLSDLRGKPIEFRRVHTDPPNIGTRWNCPTCGTAYFAIWRDAKWHFNGSKMALARGFVIDLSYYESFNDEPGELSELENPRHLCLDEAEDIQEIWGE
ncbi:hypothetical protein [Microcoleus sp. Pol12B5]|uniref:hypothetical protein n=1 Tax=Microcoleus sp. Pol12B5 TaxID=3055396 RepID=UPI002FD1C185